MIQSNISLLFTGNIHFRSIEDTDYKALEKIICNTWNYEKFCTPKTAAALSKLYLATCLCSQTYTCVALNNDEPVGVIMGKNEKMHHLSLHHVIGRFAAVLAMLAAKEGRRVLKMFDGFDNINKSLFAECKQEFGGEIAFFAVRSDQRGTGIGKELFNKLQDYMKSQDISSFYLYTDSTCNYGFYEHQGMKRICERKHCLKAYNNKEMSFFLYGYTVLE